MQSPGLCLRQVRSVVEYKKQIFFDLDVRNHFSANLAEAAGQNVCGTDKDLL